MDVVNSPAGTDRLTVVDTEEHRRSNHHHDNDWARTAERVIADASRNAQFASEQLRDNLGATKDGFFETRGDVKDGFKDSAVQVGGVAKDVQILGKDVVITEKNLQLQASTNTAALQAALCDIKFQAQAIAAQAAKEAAECCCELKELIRSENSATRALIQTNTEQSLRDTILSLRVGVGIGAVASPVRG